MPQEQIFTREMNEKNICSIVPMKKMLRNCGFCLLMSFAAMPLLTACGGKCNGYATSNSCSDSREAMQQKVYRIVDQAPGCVGVAFVCDKDTFTINNGARFAMMSVFKLHEAMAVTDALERKGISTDTLLIVNQNDMDHDTWSPMLKEYTAKEFTVSAKELMRRAIVSSDNNASNLLFNRIISPCLTDSFIRSIATDTTFAIRHTEAEMKADHALSYSNYSSPLAAALLIKQVFNDTIVSPAHQLEIQQWLATVTTGSERLGAAVEGTDNVLFAHKTGSGYRNSSGELMAFNDVAYFRLPDGRDYSLAVMIRDFDGTESEAAAIMAAISKEIYRFATGADGPKR